MNALQGLYEKQGQVLLVQTDHIPGEVIGTVIDDLYNAGAFNVQVIPSVTKKNRPGYLFVIDAAPGNHEQIESLIINELGSTGWHRLESAHRHVATEVLEREVFFDTPHGKLRFPVKIKVLKKQPDRMRPEHASCHALREALREKGVTVSLNEINQMIIEQIKFPYKTNKQEDQ